MNKKIEPSEYKLSEFNKHQLETLRKGILNEIKTRYPKKKVDYGVPPEERTPSDEEFRLILDCIYSPTHKLFFEALAYTGCRSCELINTKVEDWDLKSNCVNVWIAKKENKIKLPKYFPEILAKKMRMWFKTRKKDIKKCNGFVFFNRFRKCAIISVTASKCFREACDKALGLRFYTIADDKENPKIKGERKLRNYTLKSLRKYFVSKVYGAGGDGVMSSRLLHHKKVDVTNQHYLAISKERKKEIIEKAF